MDSSKNTRNKQKKEGLLLVIAYELGLRLLLWIVAPIVIALFIGKSLDSYYQLSGPVFFSCFIGLAFIVSSIGIVKESVRSMKYIDELDKSKGESSENKEEIDKCTGKIVKK